MVTILLLSASLTVFVYIFTTTTRTDYKRVLLHRLLINHIKTKALYDKLEELLFLKDYNAQRSKRLSYDLYLVSLKKQNDLFDKEIEELRRSRLNTDTEKYYLHLIHSHEHDIIALQSEVRRIEDTRIKQSA